MSAGVFFDKYGDHYLRNDLADELSAIDEVFMEFWEEYKWAVLSPPVHRS